jgi:threonine 3-dehydrogenase
MMSHSMRALMKTERAPGLTLCNVERPIPGYNDVLIRLRQTAICGTDMHIWNWDSWAEQTIPVPMTVGHEYVGHITEMGEGVQGFSIGDRVSGEGHIVCRVCRNCRAGRYHLCPNTQGVGVNRPGAFAEYLVIPAFNAIKIPDTISDDMASILDPFGNATHTALSFDLVGEDVLITGAGPIGILAASVARHAGARQVVITDINEYRLTLALEMGATHALNTREQSLESALSDINSSEGFSVGLEMSGQPSAFRALLQQMRHGGNVALLGILPPHTAIDWTQIIFKGLRLKGIYGREMFETWYKMMAMLESGLDLRPMITHHFPVEHYQKAFSTMQSGQSGKVILTW